MSLSIVIPVINEAENLSRGLSWLMSQQRVTEVIVVDGGSSDTSADVARAAGAKLLFSPPGRALQMNVGAASATGETLLFLHADTQLPDNAFELITQAIEMGRLWGRFNIRLSGRHWLLRVVERMINLRSCITGIATGDQALFMRREQFAALGGFAEIPLMEDIELSRRLRRLQWPCCIRQPLITSSRRWEHYGILRTILLMWQLRLAYFLGASPQWLAQRYQRSNIQGQGS